MFALTKQFDHFLFLLINGLHTPFLDFIMFWASNRFIWIPFYLMLFYFIARTEEKKNVLFLYLCIAGLLIIVSDQLSVALFKETIHRLRPCHNPQFAPRTHLIGSCGGQYGFVSSHASNCFGIAVFLTLTAGKKITWFSWLLFSWAILVSYSRIYLGVHFPADVFCGALFGSVMGILFSIVFNRNRQRLNP